MNAHLYLAPAGHGKTSYILERIRQVRAGDPLAPVSVVLPNVGQVAAFRRRLSAAGGGLAVDLGTFYRLYAEVLAWAGEPAPRLAEAVQYRLLRSNVDRLTAAGQLQHYAPLRDKPGFVVALRALVEELKRARISPEDFGRVVRDRAGSTPRLAELADIYAAYHDWLRKERWVDLEGQGWLAADALKLHSELGRDLRLLVVDGFDEFNPTQLAVLELLAERAGETIITLTGEHRPGSPFSARARTAWRRSNRALRALSQALRLEPEPLPASPRPAPALALAHLEANLFEARPQPVPADGAIACLEAQNRAEEVRAALRWLKARLVRDDIPPSEAALIARNLGPYRPFIEEVAAEFGLSLHVREGLNLATNPAIAALLSLLALPIDEGGVAWARRAVLDAWRSPYFEGLADGFTPGDADRLDAIARQGLVLHGLDQWREALARAVDQEAGPEPPAPPADEDLPPAGQATGEGALRLQAAFEAFVARITPPPRATLAAYVAFVEDLIGDDPALEAGRFRAGGAALDPPQPDAGPPPAGVIGHARAVPATAQRDVAALNAFKDVLRGLVLAEAALGDAAPMPYGQFYRELHDAVHGNTYAPPPPEPADEALPALSILAARGLSFRAVALIGLAEGEFPQTEVEDILLREADREALRQDGLGALEPRLRGDEASFFYQAVTRAREQLLLCRPYLADDGQPWEPSPYWVEVRQWVDAPLEHVRPEDPLALADVASPQEYARALAQRGLPALEGLAHAAPVDAAHLRRSAAVLRARLAPQPEGPFEGDLTHLAARFAAAYGPGHRWSASGLEAYGLCPLHFWLGRDLDLEPRLPPEEGFDVLILGTMYHEILEKVYEQAGPGAGAERLLELLPAVARQVFDQAPATHGFRPTPLWEIQRRELEEVLARTLAALAEATAGNTPLAQEQAFGMRGEPPLVLHGDGGDVQLRGFIDRVDRQPDGRLLIIDYKSGSTPIAARDLVEGRRLQIALYALAAREALGLGEIGDGFYWHIGSAKASSLALGKFDGGVSGALETARAHALSHAAGVRSGHFAPSPPASGCPAHCPGASFCWRYQGKRY